MIMMTIMVIITPEKATQSQFASIEWLPFSSTFPFTGLGSSEVIMAITPPLPRVSSS